MKDRSVQFIGIDGPNGIRVSAAQIVVFYRAEDAPEEARWNMAVTGSAYIWTFSDEQAKEVLRQMDSYSHGACLHCGQTDSSCPKCGGPL